MENIPIIKNKSNFVYVPQGIAKKDVSDTFLISFELRW